MLSTITRSGNGTAVFTIILAILLLITSEMEIIERSFWNILLNPFKVPDNFLPVIWEGLIVKNRIFPFDRWYCVDDDRVAEFAEEGEVYINNQARITCFY